MIRKKKKKKTINFPSTVTRSVQTNAKRTCLLQGFINRRQNTGIDCPSLPATRTRSLPKAWSFPKSTRTRVSPQMMLIVCVSRLLNLTFQSYCSSATNQRHYRLSAYLSNPAACRMTRSDEPVHAQSPTTRTKTSRRSAPSGCPTSTSPQFNNMSAWIPTT